MMAPPIDHPELRWYSFTGPGDEPEPEPEPEDTSAQTLQALEAAEAAAPAVADEVAHAVSACPEPELHAIEATVVDAEDRPLVGQRVELRKSDTEAMSSKSDALGVVRFEGLEPGSYQLGLPEVDTDGWELASQQPLPDARDRNRGKARWGAPPLGSTQTLRHTVEQGECIDTLAFRHGWLGDSLWEVNAALAKARTHKNVLAPGDVAEIPPVRPRFETVGVSTAARLRRTAAVYELRIRFLGDDDLPRKGEPYLLTIHSDDGEELRAGTTNGDGFVIEPLPGSTSAVDLVVGPPERRTPFHFRAAYLDPIDTIAGVQSRLLNLDFEVDEGERGTLGPITRRALAEFQREQGLEPTGELDDATRDALATLHLV